MDTTLQQAEINQVKNLETSTGKSMAEWILIANNCGLQKHTEILNFLKTNFGLGHGNANLVVHYARQSHAGASDSGQLVADQFKGKELLKPWYDQLIVAIQKFGPDVELSPKKAYVSVRRKKQFALIQPSVKTRLDIGLNLQGNFSAEGLTAAGSWNSMCTHRIKIENDSQLNDRLIRYIKMAYDQAG